MWTVPLVIVGVAVGFLILGGLLDDRRVRVRRHHELVRDNVEAALPLLHSINDDRCIGCEACIDICPTEVLELVDHKVRVIRFTDCVQCEQCAHACPTMALVMFREGTTPRMLTVPELDENFQTGVPGQYLIGEVAGKPLVKNAANLGRAVVEHITAELGTQPRDKAILDLVIVGSGPGGLSAGLTAMKRGLSHVVLEKEHVISSTVSRYPKGKHFMAEPSNAINVSFLPVFDASKEDLVAAWQKVVEKTKMPIKLGEAVETVKLGEDGVFEVRTTVAKYRSRRVVLATGLRGKPRLLAVPGANLEKVLSLLDDPADFAGEHVLVVGGGDSAVEGAMSLVDVGATVTLSYRGDGFKRCKQGNQKRLGELVEKQRISVLLESNVKEFTADEVSIKLKDGTTSTIPNNHAFVLIGADTPVVWLEANNVRFIERPHLYTLGASEELVRRLVPDAVECSRNPADAVALILGQQTPAKPAKAHKPKPARSVVGHLADEFRDAVSEVSKVFHLKDLETRPPARLQRGAHGAILRDTPVTGMNIIRRAAEGRVVPPPRSADCGSASGIVRSEFGPERTISAANSFGPESTAIGGRPIRPHQRLPGSTRPPARPPTHTPIRRAVGGADVSLRDILSDNTNVLDRLGDTGALPTLGDTSTLVSLGGVPAGRAKPVQVSRDFSDERTTRAPAMSRAPKPRPAPVASPQPPDPVSPFNESTNTDLDKTRLELDKTTIE